MRILFLGGTGNISAECAALLAERGHEIYVLTRGRSPVPAHYHALQADRRDPVALRAAVDAARPDVVINFLGYELADVQLDYQLLRGAVAQYIFISSATVYAKPPPRLPITEQTPVGNPLWDYAQKKLQCEQWLAQRWAEERFPVTIIRPSHTYSHRWIPNPISSSSYTFAARLEQGKPVFIPDDGQTPWTLTAASDFALGLAGLIGRADVLGETFHITSDEVLTWNQIYAEIAAALGVERPVIVKVPTDFICRVAPRLTGTLKGDKAHPGIFDNSKIKRFVPEFQCRKPFRDGIREAVAWLRTHLDQRHYNPEVDTMCDAVIAAWEQANPRPRKS
jgi:nucleoside-diphosphate-sugar epimerase